MQSFNPLAVSVSGDGVECIVSIRFLSLFVSWLVVLVVVWNAKFQSACVC